MNKKNLLIILCIGILTITQSCKSINNTSSNNDNIESLYFYQNGKEKIIDSESILVDRTAFSIRFFNKKYNPESEEFYAARIVALLDIKELDDIKIGMKHGELARFSLGTGMAGKQGGYENLIFSSSGHHYLYYENSENRRLNLIKKGDIYQKLEFEIAGFLFYDSGNKIPMSETKLTEFYLAILIDRNLNGTIDKSELTKLTVKIK